MFPTFRPCDLLAVEPVELSGVRPGDVVFFRAPSGLAVIHRVIEVEAEGIRTQGDNNPQRDEWLLSPDKIIGKVVRMQRRGNTWHPVQGGPAGLACFRRLRLRVTFWHAYRQSVVKAVIRSMGHGIDRALARAVRNSARIHRWVGRRLNVLTLHTDSSVNAFLLWNNRVVGKNLGGVWHVIFPFTFLARDPVLSVAFGLAAAIGEAEEASNAGAWKRLP